MQGLLPYALRVYDRRSDAINPVSGAGCNRSKNGYTIHYMDTRLVSSAVFPPPIVYLLRRR